jgi:antitoxin component YwqK of YwqJK toxin-antitoxin module
MKKLLIFITVIIYCQLASAQSKNSGSTLTIKEDTLLACFRASNKMVDYYIIFKNDTINNIINNNRYGKWVFFRNNGYVKKVGYYEWGLKQGYWKYYNRKNRLKKIIKYKNDQKIEVFNLKLNNTKSFMYKEKDYNFLSPVINWTFPNSRFIEKGNCP